MYQVILYSEFKKQLIKLSRKNKILKGQAYKAIDLLSVNITHPSLKLHKLSGENIWSISVNKSIRIILSIVDNKIYLLEIGTHDEVY